VRETETEILSLWKVQRAVQHSSLLPRVLQRKRAKRRERERERKKERSYNLLHKILFYAHVPILRQKFFPGKRQVLLLKPSTDWMRATLTL
jgi:hypothetical protein